MARDKIYIYAGEQPQSSVLSMMLSCFGESFARNGLAVAPIFGAELLEGAWMRDARAIIIGGMESTILRNALSPHGVFQSGLMCAARERGIHYVGFCGGAFMAWDEIRFRGDGDYYREGPGFGLYGGVSHGAARGFTPKDFTGASDSAAIIPLRHASGRYFHALYCCGPYFPASTIPPGARVLASARNLRSGEDTIFGVQIPAAGGHGSVSLYGHHPEYSADFIAYRTREVPSIPAEDARLRREAAWNTYGITLGFNLMLYDIKTAMGLPIDPHRLLTPSINLAPAP